MFKESMYDVWYLFNRANKKFLANPLLVFFSIFMPMVFLVLFTQLFSTFENVPGFPSGNYLQFAVAGILVLNTFTIALQSGSSIVDDQNSGFLAKVLATPATRFSIILGRLLSDGFRVVMMGSIILFLAWLMGVDFATGAAGIIMILLIVGLFGMAWSGVSIAIGLITESSETVSALPMVLSLPLLFMSTALVPFSLLPKWMQDTSDINPVSYAVDAIRALTSTGFDWNVIGLDLLLTLSILILTLMVSAHKFRSVTG